MSRNPCAQVSDTHRNRTQQAQHTSNFISPISLQYNNTTHNMIYIHTLQAHPLLLQLNFLVDASISRKLLYPTFFEIYTFTTHPRPLSHSNLPLLPRLRQHVCLRVRLPSRSEVALHSINVTRGKYRWWLAFSIWRRTIKLTNLRY